MPQEFEDGLRCQPWLQPGQSLALLPALGSETYVMWERLQDNMRCLFSRPLHLRIAKKMEHHHHASTK